jgi:hypothetical protein
MPETCRFLKQNKFGLSVRLVGYLKRNHGEFDGRNTCAHGKVETVTTVLSENLKERVHLGELHVGGLVILKWILRKQDVRLRSELYWLRIETCSGVL